MIKDKSLLNTVCVLSHFSHVQLCDPMDHNPPCSSIHRIFQGRIREWVDMSFPSGPGIESASLMSPALNATWEAKIILFSGNSSKMPGLQGQVKYCLFEN